ncbi:MAG: hypothetical protein ABIW76_20235 [Fibrobacteria bacterium]
MNRLSNPFLAISVLVVLSADTLSQALEMDGHDVLLSLPYAAKAALPLVLLPGALEQPEEAFPVEGLLLATMTLPNTMALANVYTGDAEGAQRWRKAVFWCDMGLAVTAAGLGAYLLSSPWTGPGSEDRRNDRAVAGGFLLGAYALPLFGSAYLDRKAFHMEDASHLAPDFSVGLAPAGKGHAMLATSDWLLSSPYALKAIVPLLLLPAAIMDPDGLPVVAALMAGVSFPNSMVLHRLTDHDPAGTRKWRKIAFRCELGMAAALAAYGTYLIVSSKLRTRGPGLGWDAFAGSVIIVLGAIPLAALSLIDLAPFKLEDYPAHFTLGLKIPPPGSVSYVPGLAVGLRLSI